MTKNDFAKKVVAVYQHEELGESGRKPYSTKKNARYQLRVTCGDFLKEMTDKTRKAVEGAIYNCQTVGILTETEANELVSNLYEVK